MGEALVPQIPGDGGSALLRRARCRDAAGRCAGIPPRRRRAEDAARRSGSGRSSAVRAGEGARHPGALRAHRVHGRHQRRQRRAIGHRHRHRRRQGRVLGHRRRADGVAEDRRVRRRIRDVRRPRAGTEDPGHRAADRQAAPGLLLGQQRRHRRRAARRRGAQQVRRLPTGRPVDVVRMERVLDTRRPRLRADPGRAEDDGGVGSRRSPADDRVRQDDEGLLAGGGGREDSRRGRSDRRLPEPSLRRSR